MLGLSHHKQVHQHTHKHYSHKPPTTFNFISHSVLKEICDLNLPICAQFKLSARLSPTISTQLHSMKGVAASGRALLPQMPLSCNSGAAPLLFATTRCERLHQSSCTRLPTAAVHNSTSNSNTSSSDASAATNAQSSSSTVSYRGVEFTVPPGTKLRTAMLQAGVSPHNGRAQLINCRGLGTCGTCAVEVRWVCGVEVCCGQCVACHTVV